MEHQEDYGKLGKMTKQNCCRVFGLDDTGQEVVLMTFDLYSGYENF